MIVCKCMIKEQWTLKLLCVGQTFKPYHLKIIIIVSVFPGAEVILQCCCKTTLI